MQTLSPKRLTPASFEPFGEVLLFYDSRSWPVNGGRAKRANTSARFERTLQECEPTLAIYRSHGEALPLRLDTFERHPLSSQAFVALSVRQFLIVVAPDDASNLPDLSRAEAFVGCQGEGINYARNLWHAPISAIGPDGDFLMFMWEGGGSADCIFHHTGEPLLIDSLVLLEE